MPILTSRQALQLAIEHHQAGRLPEADSIYRQLLAKQPEDPDLNHLLGLAAHHSGRLAEAQEWMRKAIAIRPHDASFYNNFGLLLTDSRLDGDAVAALKTARVLDPANAAIHYNLGNALAAHRQSDAAMACYRTALQLQPQHVKAWLNLGMALASANRLPDAIAVYREARERCPHAAVLAINLGAIYNEAGMLDESAAAYRSALALAPNDPFTLNNLGNVYKNCGQIAEALAAFRQSLATQPSAEVHSNLIFALLFDPETTPEMLREEQRRWNTAHATPLQAQRLVPRNDRSPNRRLRIGYVSADLRDHVVGRAFLPVFEAHDPAAVECFCYAGEVADTVAERFRAKAEQWRDVTALADTQLGAQIRADGIDILVDLALHTAYNRLRVFACKPAPIQVSWLGYPGSSGLDAVDYWLTDRFLDPPDTDDLESAQRPFRLPEAWCCYPAPEDSPEINELPAIRAGHITFGSFNNFSKINDRVLNLWARILQVVPDSRLHLLSKDGSHQEHLKARLRERGVAPERLEMLTYQPASPGRTAGHFLQRYARVDIALDPFPYNGMTTTCDAIWMGVPVVALRGTNPISRASFSLLSNLGLPELAASTEDEYVSLATTLAHDLSRVEHLRRTLRQRMKDSPLLDPRGFARHLENAYRAMWRDWCST